MGVFNVIMGLFFIGLGFLVKSSPNLIAGYNTMPEDKKKNIDIDGLSICMRNVFIAIGLAIIAGFYLFQWIGLTSIANSMIFISTVVGVTVLLVVSQKFDHNKSKKSKAPIVVLILTILCVIGFVGYSFIPTKAIFENDSIRFKGDYGVEVKISDIENVELADKLPSVMVRTNGISFGKINKGTFVLEEFGKCRLLLNSNTPPYLIIKKSNGDRIILNFNNEVDTQALYGKIKEFAEK